MTDGRSRLRVPGFLAGLLALAVALQVVVVTTLEGSERSGHTFVTIVGVLLVAFALSEVAAVHVPHGRNTLTVTFSDVPLIVGLFLLGPAALVAVRVGGALVPLALRTRRSPRKLVFNLGWYWVEACTAALLWHGIVGALGEDGLLSPATWLAAGVVTVATDALGTLVIACVIAVDAGVRPRLTGLLSEANPVVALVNASAALVVLYVLSVDWLALWTLAVVVGVLVYAQRAHNRLRRRTASLEEMGRFTGEVGAQLDVEAAAVAAVAWINRQLKAEVVELDLTERFAGRARLWVGGYDSAPVESAGEPRAGALVPWLGGDLLLVTARNRDRALGRAMHEAGLRDAMVMALQGDGEVIGRLLVGDRLGDVESFGRSDLGELQALGNHLSVTLRNARRADVIREHAEEQLRRSLRDDLTGLGNRRCVEELLARAATDGRAATVISLDLDRFAEINDTLGYGTGDALLVMVADRLRRCVPEYAVVARLGGDEFAVALPGADETGCAPVVSLVRQAFALPFELDELQVSIDASLGVAGAPAGGDPADLLRRSGIATYIAKSRRTGVERYRSELEVGSPARLTLLTELRRAIAGGELAVHYQPKVRLQDGEVVGAEALVRWNHPVRGVVGPDEFVPLAEQSGLITPLTFAVLRTALDECAGWRRSGQALGVAVNVSPRSLLEPSFVDEVARSLAVVEVPASALTLEVTESSLMADPERAIEALTRLRALGVRLSIDDMGTGYSSLSYLQRLPVTEVKIDRSFLGSGAEDPDDVAIVGAIVDLGHRLGHQVVAEGVELEPVWRRLQAVGCDVAQGYWLSPPLPAADFADWLARWRPTGVAALRAIS